MARYRRRRSRYGDRSGDESELAHESAECCCPKVFQIFFAEKLINKGPSRRSLLLVLLFLFLLLTLRSRRCPPPVCTCGGRRRRRRHRR